MRHSAVSRYHRFSGRMSAEFNVGPTKMARKVFQDFAHVMCQNFLEAPSNRDLVALAILGDGELILDIAADRATHNRHAIEPLPFMEAFRTWLASRQAALSISPAELVGAQLTVNYTVVLSRKAGLGWLCAKYSFACTGIVSAHDRKYTNSVSLSRAWGLHAPV